MFAACHEVSLAVGDLLESYSIGEAALWGNILLSLPAQQETQQEHQQQQQQQQQTYR